MLFEAIMQEKMQAQLRKIAKELKTIIEYEFSVEYGKVDLGEPTISGYSVIFDLSGLSDYEKQLLNDIYYDNAKKRRQKGGE